LDDHRFAAALRAISARRSGVIAAALALPPFKPPAPTERYSSGVFRRIAGARVALFLDLARGNIDDQLGELVRGIAGGVFLTRSRHI
jgi:hypothetical protein